MRTTHLRKLSTSIRTSAMFALLSLVLATLTFAVLTNNYSAAASVAAASSPQRADSDLDLKNLSPVTKLFSSKAADASSTPQRAGSIIDLKKLPPGAKLFSWGVSDYVWVPGRMTWPQADEYARRIVPGKSQLVVFESMQEHRAVMTGLQWPSIALSWAGYHRYKDYNAENILDGWRTVNGGPFLLSVFNSNGPDSGCRNKFKLTSIFVDGNSAQGTAVLGKFCKPKENSGIIWIDRGGLLEDVSQNHSSARGLVVEIRR